MAKPITRAVTQIIREFQKKYWYRYFSNTGILGTLSPDWTSKHATYANPGFWTWIHEQILNRYLDMPGEVTSSTPKLNSIYWLLRLEISVISVSGADLVCSDSSRDIGHFRVKSRSCLCSDSTESSYGIYIYISWHTGIYHKYLSASSTALVKYRCLSGTPSLLYQVYCTAMQAA